MEVYAPVSPPDDFINPPFDLLTAVNWLTGVDQHWLGGIQYDANCAEAAITTSPCVSGSPDSSVLTKAATFSHVVRGARPFTVYSEIDCSAPGGGWENDRDRAVVALTQAASTLVEQCFWNGQTGKGAPVFPNLSTTGPLFDSTNRILLQPQAQPLITGSGNIALDVVEGIGRLESQIGLCYDGIAYIHVPSVLGPALAARAICYVDGGKLYTYNGNRVILGKGYTGGGPDGAAAPTGAVWVRATSPVFGVRGSINVLGDETAAFDRSVNTLKMIAEQTYLLGWKCCLAGVLITTGGELAGLPGTAQAQS